MVDSIERRGVLGGPGNILYTSPKDVFLLSSLSKWSEGKSSDDVLKNDVVLGGEDLIKPIAGFNWGKAHPKNAVDIANACGTPVVASASGLVVPDGYCDGSLGWNGGYGTCLTVEHIGGLKTKYAHLSSTTVSLGQYIRQGEKIGEVGITGEATGCHIHFEVQGIKNPFIL